MATGVIIIYRCGLQLDGVQLLTVHYWTLLDYLTSNQVGLPAELKHINKRRKRN